MTTLIKKGNGLIIGDFLTREVYINGQFLTPVRSQKIHNHSPNGFSWGYGGSGPAQLALAILLELTNGETAIELYQEFKWDMVATLPQDDFELPIEKVTQWLCAH